MKAMRWISLISGVLLVVLGVIMMGTPVANIIALSIFMCISLLVSGIVKMVMFFTFDKANRSAWLMVDGILSVLLGGWVVFGGNIDSFALALPFVLAFWLTVNSIMMAINSFDLKSWGSKNWGWVLALGIIGTMFGFSMMFSPLVLLLTVSFALSFMFIYRGIADIIFFFSSKSLK